jgi:hypothetical protein
MLLIGDNGDNTPVYNLIYQSIGSVVETIAERRNNEALILGGSPLALILKSNESNAGLLTPYVANQDNLIQVGVTGPLELPVYHTRMRVGMVASTLLQDLSANLVSGTGVQLFKYIKTQDTLLETPARNKANASEPSEEQENETLRIGAIFGSDIMFNGEVGGEIMRSETAIVNEGSTQQDSASARGAAEKSGAVFVQLEDVAVVGNDETVIVTEFVGVAAVPV